MNVDCNAQHIIDQWKQRSGIVQDSDGMDVLSQTVKQKDEAVRGDLKTLLRDYATDLYVDDGPSAKEPEKPSTPTPAVITAEPTKASDETKKEADKKVQFVPILNFIEIFEVIQFLTSDRRMNFKCFNS